MAVRWLRIALLIAAVCAVVYSAYQPHWRAGEARFPTPVHLDEYVHWGFARAIQHTGSVEESAPFTATTRDPDSSTSVAGYPTEIHERGFQAYLAALQSTTGIPWIALLEAFPTVVALYIALLLYLIAERWGGGIVAVLAFAAVPTSLRFLGPGFAVPIMLGIALALLVLLLTLGAGTGRRVGAIGILTSALWPIHAMAAMLAAWTIVFGALLGTSRRRAGYAMAIVAPFLLAWPFYERDLSRDLLRQPWLPPEVGAVQIMGVGLFLIAALGVGALVAARSDATRRVGWTMGTLLAALLAVVVLRVATGWDPLRLYDRSVTSALVLLSLAASGAAIAARAAGLRLSRRHRRLAVFPMALLILGQGAVTALAIGANAEQPYYRVLSQDQAIAYGSAGALAQDAHVLAVVDGPSSMGWVAITGIPAIHTTVPGGAPPPPEIERFFAGGAADTFFLVEQGATIVVTERPVANPDLRTVAPGVYVLREDYATRLLGTTR